MFETWRIFLRRRQNVSTAQGHFLHGTSRREFWSNLHIWQPVNVSIAFRKRVVTSIVSLGYGEFLYGQKKIYRPLKPLPSLHVTLWVSIGFMSRLSEEIKGFVTFAKSNNFVPSKREVLATQGHLLRCKSRREIESNVTCLATNKRFHRFQEANGNFYRVVETRWIFSQSETEYIDHPRHFPRMYVTLWVSIEFTRLWDEMKDSVNFQRSDDFASSRHGEFFYDRAWMYWPPRSLPPTLNRMNHEPTLLGYAIVAPPKRQETSVCKIYANRRKIVRRR